MDATNGIRAAGGTVCRCRSGTGRNSSIRHQ